MTGKSLAVNPAFVNLLGYNSRLEVLSLSTPDFYYNIGDRKNLWRILEAQGSVKNFEVQLVKKDGSPFWTSINVKAMTDENNTIVYIDGIVEDISERRQVEEALIESEERYRILAETAQDIIILHDFTGKILYINTAGLLCLGYKQEQLIGKSLRDFVSPGYHQEVLERLKKRRSGLRDLILYHIELIDSKGVRMPFERKFVCG